jgi:two-component system phosphate regulon response regulator PhoB/two-component system alkaline phosphatase synthesis response regulator PhoP
MIAVVDDEPDIVELILVHLKRAGFSVKGFSRGDELLRFLQSEHPALVVLDLMLPDMDGFDVCRSIRQHPQLGDIRIIMLTAKGDEVDRVLGLELGADDYVTKPFSPRELVARVKAVLRRPPERRQPDTLRIGKSLEIDAKGYVVRVDGKAVHLTATEFRILELLAANRGWVFTREQILNHLWGEGKIVLDRTIDVHVRNLRRKLGAGAHFIRNVRGVGYKLEE